MNEDIQKLANYIRTLDDSALDSLVEDVKYEEAAIINDDSIEAQIEFLLESGYSIEDIKEEVTECE